MNTINAERTLNEWAAGWSTQDIERVISLCTDQCLYEDVPFGVVNHGKDELRAFGQRVFNAFPDLKIGLTAHVAAADWAMLEWTMSSTDLLVAQPAAARLLGAVGSGARP